MTIIRKMILFDAFSHFSPEDHTDQKVKNIFEADIQLTKSDSEGVNTKDFNSYDTADVDVDSVVTKRKAISSRRHLWVTKEVPVELETTASKMSQNLMFLHFYSSAMIPLTLVGYHVIDRNNYFIKNTPKCRKPG